MWLVSRAKEIGMVPFKIPKYFILPIARLTRILTEVIFLPAST